MVEPVSLGVITAVLVAKALDRAEDKAVDEGAGALQKLVAVVRARFGERHDDDAGGLALARLEDAPDSPTRVSALADVVDSAIAVDPDFRSDVEAAVAEASSAGIDVESLVQMATGDRNVQIAAVQDSEVNVNYGSSPGPVDDAVSKGE